jgi:ABC-type multidrug transport system ATPase subunit
MQGYATIQSKGSASRIELPQSDCYLAVGDSLVLHYELPKFADNVIRVRWIENQFYWLLSKQGSTEKRQAFIDQLAFEINGIDVHFRKFLDQPVLMGGTSFDTLKLTSGSSYLLGKAGHHTTQNNFTQFICLDPQCTGLDGLHAKLEQRGNDWYLMDLSQRGTTLNGNAFRDDKLTYGDRFAIDEYLFEYRTNEIRRVDHLNMGGISARNLCVDVIDYKNKKPKRILNEVSLQIQTGEFIGILGGSGQGKSTLMNALCGMRKADNGSVMIGGIPVEKISNDFPGVIGYVPQDDIVHKELTVMQALDYSARLKLKLSKKERTDLILKTIERLGLKDHKDKKIAILSGGQRKRLSIAIELLSKPSVLFLDEPSSGLDPSTEASLMELLQSLAKNKLTVICTTHVLQKAYLFDRLLFIHDGRLIFDGNAQETRTHFLDAGFTETKFGFVQSPLEKVYSVILAENFDAKEWELKFQARKKSNSPQVQMADGGSNALNNLTVNSVSSLSKLWTLLSRQHAILRSDWLNWAFLLAQVVLIGSIIAWVSNDFTFRLFLGMIASIWFGCSNGAQQIVAEFAVFKREKVCGLGLNAYVLSKWMYLGAVSMLQAFLLLLIVTLGGHVFHPYDYEEETFKLGILKRMEMAAKEANPDLSNPAVLTEEDGFIDVIDENSPEGAADKILSPEAEEQFAMFEPPEPISVDSFTWYGLNWQNLLLFGNIFHFSNNLTDSTNMAMMDELGNQVLDANGLPVMVTGVEIGEIVWRTLSLKILAYALAAMAGVGLGLAISALVRTPTQAVMWVPLLLIPQILLGGYVITVPEMPANVRKVAQIVPSYCSQRIIDNSNLFGRKMPDLSNTTKTPIFLTTNGEKDTVRWTDGFNDFEEKFDKESDVNVSWQNLFIAADRIGEHNIVREKVTDTRSVNIQIVSERTDVIGKTRDLFVDIYYTQYASIRLALCLLVAYLITTFALIFKTK